MTAIIERDGGAATPAQAATTPEPTRRILRPPVDIYESAEDVQLRVDVPGVPREAIDVRFDKGALTLEARRSDELAYVRTFAIPEGLDPAGIRASVADGVLTLMLPRAEQHKPRRIEVR